MGTKLNTFYLKLQTCFQDKACVSCFEVTFTPHQLTQHTGMSVYWVMILVGNELHLHVINSSLELVLGFTNSV